MTVGKTGEEQDLHAAEFTPHLVQTFLSLSHPAQDFQIIAWWLL